MDDNEKRKLDKYIEESAKEIDDENKYGGGDNRMIIFYGLLGFIFFIMVMGLAIGVLK